MTDKWNGTLFFLFGYRLLTYGKHFIVLSKYENQTSVIDRLHTFNLKYLVQKSSIGAKTCIFLGVLILLEQILLPPLKIICFPSSYWPRNRAKC